MHYRPRWDKRENPIEYGQLVSDIVDAIYAEQPEPGAVSARMTIFMAGWKYQRWPTQAELIPIICPPDKEKKLLAEILNRDTKITTDEALRREIKHEWLGQVVKGYGNRDAERRENEGVWEDLRPPGYVMHAAYAPENVFVLRLYNWYRSKLDTLALDVAKNPALDWWGVLPVPDAAEVENAKRMDRRVQAQTPP